MLTCRRVHESRRKAKAQSGFSLPELLVTMLIILLAAQIASGGIPAVIRAYQRAVDGANAETYLNTVTIALRNTLSFASNPVEKDENGKKVIYYTDPKVGRCKISNSDNGIQIQEGVDIAMSSLKPIARSETKTGETEFVSYYDKIDCVGDFFTVTGLGVKKDGKELELDSPYVIRKLNP